MAHPLSSNLPLDTSVLLGPVRFVNGLKGGNVSGVALPSAQAPNSRIAARDAHEVWYRAAQRTGDEAFGVRAGEALPLEALGTLGYALRHGATPGDLLATLARYSRLIHEDMILRLEGAGAHVRLVHTLRGSEAPPPACDCFVTAVVSTLRRLMGADVVPLAVSLQRATPADGSAWRRALRTQPRFGQARNELIFSEALLSAPLRGADPGLSAVLRAHLDSMLAARPANEDLVGVVRDRIERGLDGGVPDLERVAKALGLGARNLQRRLRARGLSFQQLVDVTRRDLALRRVAEGDASFAAIAVELGFSEVSAFYRAFRRWTGTTPAAHRARRGEAGAPIRRHVDEMPLGRAPMQGGAVM